jgi:hypothetical protein
VLPRLVRQAHAGYDITIERFLGQTLHLLACPAPG